MKKQSKNNVLFLCLTLVVITVMVWSCKDDDPSLEELRNDKIAYLKDSLRVFDSLRAINAAGIVNYAINVVDGSTSSIYQNGRTDGTTTQVPAALVTISQFGKTVTDTTDATGMVVFNGFFRNAVNITIRKEGFTSVSYIAAVNLKDSTQTGSVSFVGNLIPIFPLTGTNTATISGRATFESDLTNRVREFVPQAEGNIVTASIDVSEDNTTFANKFLTNKVEAIFEGNCVTCNFIYVGTILQASYQTGAIGTISNATGDYTITVPAAIDGLPLNLRYSDITANQRLFQLAAGDQNAVNKRVVFRGQTLTSAAVPASGGPTITFNSFTTQAVAAAVISATTGSIRSIEVTNGGSGYTVAPVVEITGTTGTGATATAILGPNGTVSSVTIVNAGSGYSGTITVTLVDGSGAAATTTLAVDGTVTGVAIANSGAGYVAAPSVTFSAPGGSGVTATGTAIIAAGRVTGVNITNAGSGYTANPTVTFGVAPPTGVTATGNGIYSGQSIAEVAITNNGTNYATIPTVTFSAPQRANGVRATATAQIDPSSRQVIGITVINAGSGYTAAPTITISDGTGAAAQAELTGGSVISFDVTTTGDGYVTAPTVVIGRTATGNGSGATGTAIMEGGRVVGINVTAGGSGYNALPSVELVSGDGAVAHAIVNESGSIVGFNVTKGGSGYSDTNPPRVVISTGDATATATVTGGAVTGLTVTRGGSGYEAGNTPGSLVEFSATYGNTIETRPGLKYINDIYYGTGTTREP